MKRLLVLSLLGSIAASAFAQTPACTTVTDTLYVVGVSAPILANGTIDLTLGYTAADGSFVILQSAGRQTIATGTLSTCLAPGTYSAQYSMRKTAPLTGTTSFTRYWVVPATGGPYTIQAIETPTPPNPPIYSISASSPLTYLNGVIGGIPAPPPSGTYCLESANATLSWQACGTAGSVLFDSATGFFDSSPGLFDSH